VPDPAAQAERRHALARLRAEESGQ
jgi:hypothetical protein